MPYYNMNTGMHTHRHPFYGADEALTTDVSQLVPEQARPCRCHGHHGHHGHRLLTGIALGALIVGGVCVLFKLFKRTPSPGPLGTI